MKLATEMWKCSKSSIAALIALFLAASIADTRAVASPTQRERSDRQAAHKRRGQKQKADKQKSKAQAVPKEEKPLKCPVSPASVPLRFKQVTTESTPFVGSKVYRPKDKGKYLSIVVLHGSEGGSAGPSGFTDSDSMFLARQGYAVLALCYFDCARKPGTPLGTLKDAEATKVLDAVDWLRRQPFSNGKVVAYGKSRGAELALIAGSLDAGPRALDALIAHSPSDTFHEPVNEIWEKRQCWLCKKAHCSSDTDFSWNPKCGPDDPRHMDFLKSAWLINGTSVPNETRIPVEKFNGPILITVGEKDELWPVDQTRRIEAKLKEAGKKPEVYYFPGAGHIFNRRSDAMCVDTLLLDFLRRVDSVTPPKPDERQGEEATEMGSVAPAH